MLQVTRAHLVGARLGLAIAVVAAAATARAQSEPSRAISTTAVTVNAPLKFEWLTTGLVGPQVVAMVQDPLGFVWVGTTEALTRYDGQSFKVFKSDILDPASLSSSFITSLAVDKEGRVWVGTGNGGLNRYDPATGTFTRYRAAERDDALSSDGILKVYVDSKGLVWVSTGDGLNQWDAAKDSFIRYTDPPLNIEIADILDDGTGTLWLGATTGLFRFAPGSGEVDAFSHLEGRAGTLPGPSVKALALDRDKRLWVGTNNGLGMLNPDGKSFTVHRHDPKDPSSLVSDAINFLLSDRGGRLWIGTVNGLARLLPDGKTFVRHVTDPTNPYSLAFPTLVSVMEDRGGVIWIGTYGQGINRFDPLRLAFRYYRPQPGSGATHSFTEDAAGNLWVGTIGAGLWRYDKSRTTATAYASIGTPGEDSFLDLGGHKITALHVDPKGTLWVGTEMAGMFRLDPDTGESARFTSDNSEIPSDLVFDLKDDGKGGFWLATYGGVARFAPATGTFTLLSTEEVPALSSDAVNTVVRDPTRPGVLWLGTGNGGLNELDTSSKAATVYRHADDKLDSLPADGVYAILPDKDGNLWLGTDRSLGYFDRKTGRFEQIAAVARLFDGTVWGVQRAADGAIWASTHGGGLIRYQPSDKSAIQFTAADGVQDDGFGQGGSYAARDGTLYFGGTDGFTAFYPETVTIDSYSPTPVVTDFRIANQPVDLSRPIWMQPALGLGFRDRIFTFEFAAPTYAGSEAVRFQFHLDGFDKDWVEVDGSRRIATYTNMDGGDYTFRVRSINRHGIASEGEVAVKISVDPPPWRRWWAYVLYGLLVVAGVLLFLRWQNRRIKALERDNRLASHERDLELTAAVQTSFLPKNSAIQTGRFRLQGYYRAANLCSGDWWWHETAGVDQHIILVGDVTGHGAGPAMVTAAVATAFSVQQNQGLSMEQRFDVVNREVVRVGAGRYLMTMSAMILDERTGRYEVFSAGGLPILLMAADGKSRVVPCRGTPLGSVEFVLGKVTGLLRPSERALLYTDGVTELEVQPGRQLGVRRLVKMFEASRGQAVDVALSALVAECDVALGTSAQDDDWTLAVLEWN